eukprot:GGOE01044498.1.p1 GENE.GGOE01044498.1~~GGOE01044498.1.p1  ORF type:complete len:305 (+),score=46.53 GGOE01044498.1:92-916(+)
MHEDLVVPAGDILIHTGDFCYRHGHIPEYKAFDKFLAAQPHKYKLVVLGNHDLFRCRTDYRALLPHADHVFYFEEIRVMGLRIFGISWGFRRDVEINQGVDIVCSHDAPFEILDKLLSRKLRGRSSPHIGSMFVLHQVEFQMPQYHLFGHIHERNGTDEVQWPGKKCRTIFHNGSMADPDTRTICNHPFVFSIRPSKIVEPLTTIEKPRPKSKPTEASAPTETTRPSRKVAVGLYFRLLLLLLLAACVLFACFLLSRAPSAPLGTSATASVAAS